MLKQKDSYMLNLCICNLGKYNEGVLTCNWISAPFEEDEFSELLKEIGINEEYEEYEEYFICDWECNLPGVEIGEYSNITRLNELMLSIEDAYLTSNEMSILEGIVDLTGCSIYEALSTLKSGSFSVLYNVRNYYDVGEALLKGMTIIPDILDGYINFEEYGKDSEYELISNNMALDIII